MRSMFPPSVSASWSGEQLRRLRELAAESVPIETIAMLLRRTPSAIRNKAAMHGISLRAARLHTSSSQNA